MYQPVMIGNLVKKYLKEQLQLKIHSQFNHGFNLQQGKQLIFIGDDQKGSVPFGIHLKLVDLQRLQDNLTDKLIVVYQREALYFGDQSIDLTQSHSGITEIEELDPRNITSILSEFEKFEKGAGLDFLALLKWQELATGLLADSKADCQKIEEFILKLIGAGIGLTPAGDDFLVGILAINQSYSFLDSIFKETLESLLGKELTTDVSISYLEAALEGSFSSGVLGVIKQLQSGDVTEALNKLSQSGSSSGCDTIMGMYWALVQINYLQHREIKNEKTCSIGTRW